jgi:hypothetical protein
MFQRLLIASALITLLAPLASGCFPATSKAAFIGDAEELRCSGVYPACQGQFAGCALDEEHYISGAFPGSRKFIVETPPGDWKIKVMLFLDPEASPRFPGTELEVSWFEPGCSDQYRFLLSKDNTTAGDLFERAGRDNVFETQHSVIEPGDHLVSVFSDATTRYVLKVELIKES